MEFEMPKSKVYVFTDDLGNILCVDGGYTIENVDEETWTLIDEGYGDKYNLCQSHYFEDGYLTNDGIPKYNLVDGEVVERTEEEIEADRRAIAPEEEPTTIEDVVEALNILTGIVLGEE